MGVIRRSDVRRRVRPAVRRRDERGAAAVEFALVLPILLLLVFGVIAYGYMLSFRGSLSQAAAEGAREAAVNVNAANREDAAMEAVDEALRAYGVDCSDSAMTCDYELLSGEDGCATTCVRISLEYAYEDKPLIPLPFVDSFMPDTIAYAASARTS